MGTGSFPGVKQPGHGADHQPHPSTEVKNEELYLYFPSGPFVACYRVTCTLHCMSLIVNFGTRTYKTGHIPYNNSLCIYLPTHTPYIQDIQHFTFSNTYALPFCNQTALCAHQIMWMSFHPAMYLLPHTFNKLHTYSKILLYFLAHKTHFPPHKM
jgi:hypothetical protein